MSIPFSRPVGFSAIIRKAGKEWVTSDTDKKGSAAEVVDIMQSSLAVLQFPLAAVPSATPDAGPPSQDFAISFAEDPSLREGDATAADPTMITLDQPVVWVAPIISVPRGFPVGLAVADGTQGELTGLQDSVTLPNELQLLISVAEPESIETESPSNAINYSPDGPKAESASARITDNPSALGTEFRDPALHPESLRTTEPWDMRSHEAMAGKHPASRPQEVAAADPAPKQSIASDDPGVKVANALPTPGAEQANAVETVRSATEARPRQSLSAEVGPGKRLVATLPADQVGPAEVHSDVAPATGEIALTRLTDAKTTFPQGLEARTSGLPDGDVRDAPDTVDASKTGTENAAPKAPVPGSFWERYFSDRSDSQSASVPSPEQVAQTAVERVMTAIGIAPRLATPKGDSIAGPFLDDVQAASDAEVAETVTVKAAAPPDGSGPTPASEARPEPGPALQVLPWNEGLPDRADRLDSPLSSLPASSSGSASGVSAGSGGPISLPVQQVAIQLAGVLVQVSDRATELALAPEELGKVRLRLETDAANPDRLTIIINVERPETLDLFRRHAGELAEAIRAAGYAGADIDFGAHGQSDSGKGQHSGPSTGPDLPSDETPPIQHSPRTIAGATLDLRL